MVLNEVLRRDGGQEIEKESRMRLLLVSHDGRKVTRNAALDSEHDAMIQERGRSAFRKQNRSRSETTETFHSFVVQIVGGFGDVSESDATSISRSEERNRAALEQGFILWR